MTLFAFLVFLASDYGLISFYLLLVVVVVVDSSQVPVAVTVALLMIDQDLDHCLHHL